MSLSLISRGSKSLSFHNRWLSHICTITIINQKKKTLFFWTLRPHPPLLSTHSHSLLNFHIMIIFKPIDDMWVAQHSPSPTVHYFRTYSFHLFVVIIFHQSYFHLDVFLYVSTSHRLVFIFFIIYFTPQQLTFEKKCLHVLSNFL